MPTKTISTIMNAQQLDATHFLQLSTLPCKVFNLEGYVNGTAGTQYYLQLLGVSQASAVSGTTVPLYSRQVLGGNGFSFTYVNGIDTARMQNPDPVKKQLSNNGNNVLPVYAAISSTDTVYTAVAAATDLAVDIEQSVAEGSNYIKASNILTTTLGVWADDVANTKYRLMNFTFDATGSNAACFVQLSTFSPSAGTIPLISLPVPAGGIITKHFGSGLALVQSAANYVPHYGCIISTSSTPTVYTASGITPVSILANYIDIS
jgi:hypothetical protein